MLKSRWLQLSLAAALLLALAVPVDAIAQQQGQAAQEPSAEAGPQLGRRLQRAIESISGSSIEAHARFLAGDLLEGRGTGQRGGELAAEYIATQFQLMGMGAPVPNSAESTSFFQKVPLVGMEMDRSQSIVAFANDEETYTPTFLEEAVFWTETQQEMAEASGELVFVGYGVYAPEVQWDDYKDVDVTGKILLMLVNDPPSEDPAHFGGKALTYYGRWTYKFWIAAAKGAAGCILIHTPDMAGYGWDVVRNSWGEEQSFIPLNPEGTPPLKVSGWVTEATGQRLVVMGGQDLAALTEQAKSKDFQPVSLGLDTAARIVSKKREFETRNVVGWIPGSDPAKQSEFIIYTAHYDHLGIGADVDGDSIYNGLQDNALGVGSMLEIAQWILRARPARSSMFIAMAAEEQGLLGSKHFTAARNLFIHPANFAANINLDGLHSFGEPRDYVFLGGERSPQIQKAIDQTAAVFQVGISPDPHPEKGYYYRSDHFNFAQIGVPSVSIKDGSEYVDQPPGWGEERYQEYLSAKYHRPTDQYDETIDFKGIEKTARIAFLLGYLLGTEPELPAWVPGDEFEEARQEALTDLAERAAQQSAGGGQ